MVHLDTSSANENIPYVFSFFIANRRLGIKNSICTGLGNRCFPMSVERFFKSFKTRPNCKINGKHCILSVLAHSSRTAGLS